MSKGGQAKPELKARANAFFLLYFNYTIAGATVILPLQFFPTSQVQEREGSEAGRGPRSPVAAHLDAWSSATRRGVASIAIWSLWFQEILGKLRG